MSHHITSRLWSTLYFVNPWGKWLWVFVMDIGLSVSELSGKVQWTWLDHLSSTFWWIMLVVGILGFSIERFHRLRMECEERDKAMRSYRALNIRGGEVYAAFFKELDGNSTSKDCDRFVEEKVKPWVYSLQKFAAGTTWGKTGLAEGVEPDTPYRDYESIMKFINDKRDLVEDIHNKYDIEDEDDR